jgi:hypothetical protein
MRNLISTTWHRADARLRQATAAAVTVTALALAGASSLPASAEVTVAAPPVAAAVAPDGKGYWVASSDGGVFAFGTAGFYGSMGGKPLNKPIVGITATPDGKGYWEVAADGGIFAYGTAGYFGSMGGQQLAAPMVAIAAHPHGGGYWMLGADGGVFAFGTSQYYGRVVYTTPTSPPVSVPSGSAKDLAQQLLSDSRVDKSGRLVLTDLQNTAAGKPGSSGAPVSATLLRMIVTVAQRHTVTISALESGGSGHSANSLHYSGDAVDFARLDGHSLTGRDASSLAIISEISRLLPYGSGFGQSNCYAPKQSKVSFPAGVSEFVDSCDHLHLQIPRNSA